MYYELYINILYINCMLHHEHVIMHIQQKMRPAAILYL
jgi:hypothetical protein